MKRVLYAILALATLTMASCEKDPIGGTATEKMAGQWYVQVQGVEADGSVLYEDEDLYGIGNFWILTYNTADNKSNEMWISDVDKAFWNFQVKVNCNIADATFGVNGAEDIIGGEAVDIINGKILYGKATTPSGMPADSIVFEVLFEDDPYAAPNEGKPGFKGAVYDHLRVSGYRYTGLVNDD